jgi:hypothetical protein
MRSAQWDMMLTWLQALLKLMMMKVAIAAKLTKAQTDGWPIMHTACWFADWLAMMEHTIWDRTELCAIWILDFGSQVLVNVAHSTVIPQYAHNQWLTTVTTIVTEFTVHLWSMLFHMAVLVIIMVPGITTALAQPKSRSPMVLHNAESRVMDTSACSCVIMDLNQRRDKTSQAVLTTNLRLVDKIASEVIAIHIYLVDHVSGLPWTTTQLVVIIIMVTDMATDTVIVMDVSAVMTTELIMLITKMALILKRITRTITKRHQKNMVMFGSPN